MTTRSVDGCLEDACDTGVLFLSGKSLRNYPIASEEEAPFNHKDILELDISKNRFHEIPALVYSCEALVKLNCYHNTIRAIPEGLRRLQNLQHVNLNRNFLSLFPMELCQIQKLRSLSINNNRIDKIPDEIGKLKELRSLDVSNNCIEVLPATICELTSLRRLDFHCNKVQTLPPEICKLSLTDLIMSENLIIQLPTAISKMKLLVELQVDGNPLTVPPPQICNRGKVHIFKYLSRIEQLGGSEVALDKGFGMRKNNRSKIFSHSMTNPRRRPMSNISTVSDEPSNGGRSFYDEVTNLVTNAFGPYEQGGQQRTVDTSRYNGIVPSPEKQRKMLMGRQTSGTPASPGTTRRAAQYGVTLKRRPSKDKISVVTKPAEDVPQPTNVPVINNHEDTPTPESPSNDVKTSVSPPITKNIVSSNRKLPSEPEDRPGSWNSSRSAKTTTTATLQATANATHSLSQSDVSSYSSPKPRARTNAMNKEVTKKEVTKKEVTKKEVTKKEVTKKEDSVVSSPKPVEDSLAPMRKIKSGAQDSPKSPSPSNKPVSTAPTTVKILPVKIKMDATPVKGTSKESTPDFEIKTPTAKNQPDTVPLELDSLLSSFKSDMEKEELAIPQEEDLPKPKPIPQEEDIPKPKPIPQEENLPKPQAFSKPSPKAQKKSSDLARHSLAHPSPHTTPTSSPHSNRRTEGSPANLKKKSATIASALDVELRIHNSSPNLIHRQSLPPGDTEWVDKLYSPHREAKPVFQQLNSKKQIDYTVKRHKRNIQAEMEMIEDVRDSIETVLGITLKDDIMNNFSDGVILCQLVNRLFPNTISSIMDAEPMNNVKRTKNIDSFLRACSKLGIRTVCKVGDIMDCKNPIKVCECVQALLMKGGHSTV